MVRNHRVITLRDEPHKLPADSDKFTSHKIKYSDDGFEEESRRREGDVLIITCHKQSEFVMPGLGTIVKEKTETNRYPAVIPYEWIIDKLHVEVEPDDDCSAPWLDQDGWEHEVLHFDDFFDDRNRGIDEFKQRQGYLCDKCRCIIITDESYCGESRASRIAYYQRQGASKQVAHELVALADRRYIKQLVQWYRHGWEYYWTKVEVRIGGKTYSESCGGIDDEGVCPDGNGRRTGWANCLQHGTGWFHRD